MKKIAFLGADRIAIPLLDYLYEKNNQDFSLAGIISQPDKPTGRGHKILPNPISTWAIDKKIKLFRPDKPSDQELNWIKEEAIDIAFVWAYGHILKQNFLEAPKLGMLNFHCSLLPKFRGASPVEGAIASGDTETGIALMQIVKKMDSGDIMDYEKVPISNNETSESLRIKFSKAAIPLIKRNLPKILEGNMTFTPQDETKANYTRRINKGDGWLNFNEKAKTLEYRVRALTPWPGGFFKLNDLVIKIGSCKTIEIEHNTPPGTVLSTDEEGLKITTQQGILCLTTLQKPGGRMLPAKEFLKGFPIEKGITLQNGPMLPLINNTPFPWKNPKTNISP